MRTFLMILVIIWFVVGASAAHELAGALVVDVCLLYTSDAADE